MLSAGHGTATDPILTPRPGLNELAVALIGARANARLALRNHLLIPKRSVLHAKTKQALATAADHICQLIAAAYDRLPGQLGAILDVVQQIGVHIPVSPVLYAGLEHVLTDIYRTAHDAVIAELKDPATRLELNLKLRDVS